MGIVWDLELNTSDNSFKELFSLLPEKYSGCLQIPKLKGMFYSITSQWSANESIGTFQT
jgi:hypothetical protein